MATSTTVINGVLIYILAFSILLFFMIVFFMIFFVVRYRKSRNPVPSELPSNVWIETLWVVIPTLLALTMFLYGLTTFQFLRKAPKDSLVVKVKAKQWAWIFEYPNSKKSLDLIVPMGKNIKCELFSADVIHGFYVPAFRLQQDALPGIKTMVWFNATTTGTYDILCSQYCGLKHSLMLAKLIVVPSDLFDKWMKGEKVQFSGKTFPANMSPGETLLFDRGCISCHSIEGGDMAGPSFKGLFSSQVKVTTTGKIRVITADETYIREHIINPGKDVVDGFPNIMPSFRNTLTDKEINEIIKYLKSIK